MCTCMVLMQCSLFTKSLKSHVGMQDQAVIARYLSLLNNLQISQLICPYLPDGLSTLPASLVQLPQLRNFYVLLSGFQSPAIAWPSLLEELGKAAALDPVSACYMYSAWCQ